MGAVPEAVDDPRSCQDPGDAGEGEEGEEEEFGRLCLFPALRERRDVAFLQGRRERQRLSARSGAERCGGPVGGSPRQRRLAAGPEPNGGQGQRRDPPAPSRPVPSPPAPSPLGFPLPKGGGGRWVRAAPGAPSFPNHTEQRGKIRLVFFFFLRVKNKTRNNGKKGEKK